MGVGEVNLDAGFLGEILVFGHLFSAVVGHGQALLRFDACEHAGETLDGVICIATIDLASTVKSVDRSTSVPTAERLYLPLMVSPSQWPGMSRSSISAGRSCMETMLGICPRRSWPRARGRRGCRTCVVTCPTNALFFTHGKAWERGEMLEFDQTKCIYCGACAFVCPVSSIEIKRTEVRHGDEFNSPFWPNLEFRLLNFKNAVKTESGKMA